jgi:1-aminocyclopropane-1-carboxylate deaminase/D-cysteine desulfhydrase-like pyridoxal-dependent ACC family enzyme
VVSDAVNCGVTLYLQRDDLSSFDLSGNNAQAGVPAGRGAAARLRQRGHHRRAAVAARQLGLTPVLLLLLLLLLLRTELRAEEIDLEGNLLLSRMVGAKIYTKWCVTRRSVQGSKARPPHRTSYLCMMKCAVG